MNQETKQYFQDQDPLQDPRPVDVAINAIIQIRINVNKAETRRQLTICRAELLEIQLLTQKVIDAANKRLGDD